jgi:hypothetical protein
VNSHVRARIPAIACAVALAGWCGFVFQGMWIDLARADHLALLEERLFFPTRGAYAWHLLGYQRARILSGEDLVLSRPLFDAWHAVLEGLLEVDGLVRGLVGIAVHALTVLAVFRFARRWVPLWLATLACLAIASPLPGVDLVVWRHVTPYAFGVCFLALAAGELGERSPSRGKVLVCLTLSALAHETMVAVLAAAAVVTLVLPAGERKRTWAVWTAGPIAVCAVVYALEALAFPVGWTTPHTSTGATLAGLAWIPRVLGLAALAWAAPWTFRVELDPWTRAVVTMNGIPDAIVPLVGGVLAGCALVALAVAIRSFVREDRAERNIILLVGGYLLASVVLLCFGRLGTRSPTYLSGSGYYFQIWCVCFELLAVLAVGARLRERAKAPIAVGLLVVASVSAGSAAAIVRPMLLEQRDFVRAAFEIDGAIAAAIDERPTWCFAGVAKPPERSLFAPSTPFAPLGRRVCTVHPEREPVVLAHADGRVALVPLGLPVTGSEPSGRSGIVSLRIERGSGVILQVEGDRPVGAAFVGRELHVARDGRELPDQTDVVPVADATGAHTLALAVIEGRVRALFDGMLEGDLGPAEVLAGTASVLEMDHTPRALGPITWSADAPTLEWDRAVTLDTPHAAAVLR